MRREGKKHFIRDVAKTYGLLKATGGRMELSVSIDEVHPTLEEEDGTRRRLPDRLEVTITRGKRGTSFRTDEARALLDLLDQAIPLINEAEAAFESSREAPGEQRYTPKRNPHFSMGQGKTERKRRRGN